MTREEIRLKERIKTMLELAAKEARPEVQAELVRFACILTSGYLEVAVRAIILDFVNRRSSPEVKHFTSRHLDWFQNPSLDKIIEMYDRFGSKHGERCRSMLLDEERAAIGSVVSLRHVFAHGGSAGLSVGTMSAYASRVFDSVTTMRKVVD